MADLTERLAQLQERAGEDHPRSTVPVMAGEMILYRQVVSALAEVAQDFNDAHEEFCGCDSPGHPARCVAKPEGIWDSLAHLDAALGGNQ